MAATKKKSGDLGQARDLVESVYVAIVLAFVLRAFMIEAFVIPTGSMAVTLYGEHFRLTCPACQRDYTYGRTGGTDEGRQGAGYIPTLAMCPNCGFEYDGTNRAQPVSPRGGDRVLVLKYLYDFGSPEPWDVVVFKNPQTNRENYIKRLIGLPGETIEIVNGDIFVTRPGESEPHIRRKPPTTQEAVWRVLYDNDYPPNPEAFAGLGSGIAPPWPGWQQGSGGAAWDLTGDGGRRFHYGGSSKPARIEFRPGMKGFEPFSGYNAGPGRRQGRYDEAVCTDWQLQAVLTPESSEPTRLAMVFESYADRFRAEVSTDGEVRLLHQRRDAAATDWTLLGETSVESFTPGQGRVVSLSLADYRVWISIDRQEVLSTTDQQQPGRYDLAVERTRLDTLADRARQRCQDLRQAVSRLEQITDPTETQRDELARYRDDLAAAEARRDDLEQRRRWAEQPAVYIEATGEPADLAHVRLMHDLYYTSPYLKLPDNGDPGPEFDYVRQMLNSSGAPGGPNNWRSQAGRWFGWGTQGNPIHLRDAEDDDYDEFYCLGDNSPQSHDSRLWTSAAPSLRLYENGKMVYQLGTVPRYNMLGRAMLVYWPAGYDLPLVGLPLVPNVGDMRLIR
jgi:signal peptidase I